MTKTSSASSLLWSTGSRNGRMFCNNIGRCNLNRIYGPMVSVSFILILWILIQWPLPLGLVLAQRSDIPYLSASQYELLLNQYKNQQQHQQQYQPNPNSLECDQIFISSSLNSTFGSRNGTFIGPSFNIPMPATTVSTLIGSNQSLAPTTTTTVAPAETSDETVNRYTRQCIYTFIAGPNERVRLSFTKFSLRAESPECLDEYLDIYAELRTPDTDLLSTPFGGRYCDLVIPHDRVSLFQTIVISFYTAKLTDGSQINGTEIFEGTYEFINATPYNVGTPMPNELCSFTIYSEVKREGEFMTPTYPGVYPKNITCYYLFKGVKGQRIKIEFMDFDLYYGGAHCPYDYVKIYDGESTRSPLINIYCGQQRQLLVYSSGVNLLVQFTTLKRVSAVNQNRGFSGYYEFSEKFVNLGFILNNENSEHILGTECDQKIYSRKESNGTVYAPNYPFLYHPNIMCKYFLYGLQDAQNLERINFHFEMLQIPTKDVNECTDAYVRLYTQLLAMEEFDFVFCGETIPPPVQSDGPLLLVVFNSGSTQGQGFKAHYWFETDYKIMGTQAAPGQCHFSYVSSGGQSGEFNSPRHPSNYPSNTYCVYEFFGEPDEQVLVVFNQFKFSDSEVLSLGIAGYDDKCTHDWIEIYTVHSNGREQYYGRYCGLTAPGPIITEHGVNQIKVIMNTDDNEVSSGFHANYQFDRASDRIQDCGGNFTNLENGIIQTPNYPGSYPATMQVCNWFITVRSGFRVLLYFDQFSIEGDPPNRGCPGAVVRVWINLNQNPIDLCGEKLNDDQKQFLSEFNVLRITFLTADKAVGAQGFRAIWTEIEMPPEPNDPRKNASFGACLVPAAVMAYPTPSLILDDDEDFQQKIGPASASALASPTNANRQSSKPYQCQKNGYCISSKLYCNGIQNCGHDDQSDESGCIHEVKINLVELVGGFTGLLLFTFFIIGLIGLILILIFNWYNRRSNDEKNVNQIIDKTCQHYMSHGGGMEDGPTQDYSAYYQSEPLNVGTPHRLIDVMTVSSSSTTPGGTGNIQSTIKNVRWPSASNSGDSSHHLAVANNDTQNDVPQSALFLDNGIGMASDNSPIPPPPPPPINRSMLTLRQSSLVNFHYGTTSTAPTTNDHVVSNSTFKDPNSTTRSMIGIDRNFTLGRLPLMPQQQQQQQQQQFAAYHQSNSNTSNMIGGNQTRTMSRQSENSRTSTFTTYPYCTLNNNNHHHHANNSNNTMRIASPSPLTQYVHAPQSSHHKTNVEPIVDSMDSGQLITTTNNTTMVDVDEDILMDMDNSEQQHPRPLHSNTSNHLHHHTNNKADNGDYSMMMMDHEDRFRNNNNNNGNSGNNGNNNNNNSISSNNNINNNENNGIMTNEDECDDSMILDCSIQETQPQQQQQQQPSINNTNNNNYNSTMSSLRKYQMTRITTNQPQPQLPQQQPPSSPQPQTPSSSWQHHLHHSDQTSSSTGNYLDSGIHGSAAAAAAAAHHHHHHRHHPHSSSTLILDE